MNKSELRIDKEGNKFWYLNDKLHRIDGPAVVYENGDKYWYLNDKIHRIDGPAIECSNGERYWYLNGKLHRINGPAVVYANGNTRWYLNGKRHRIDGPAIEYISGYKVWYLNGKRVSKKKVMGNNIYKIENLLQMLLEEILKYGPNQPLKDTYIQEKARDIKKELKYNS